MSNESSPKITVGVPYYRGFEYFKIALESVFAQSYPHWDLLVIDDSGEDDSGEHTPSIQDYIQSLTRSPLAQRVTVLKNPTNLGMAATWNRILDEAKTPWVMLLHSDDFLKPQYLEEISRLISQHPDASAVFTGVTVVGESGKPVFSFPDFFKRVLAPKRVGALTLRGEAALQSLLRGTYIFCPTLCYQRARLGETRFSSRYKFVLDIALYFSLLMRGEKLVGNLDQKLYAYRRHAENATSQYTRNMLRFQEEWNFYQLMGKELRSMNWSRAAHVAERAWIVMLNLLYCTVMDLISFQWARAKNRLQFLKSHWMTRSTT